MNDFITKVTNQFDAKLPFVIYKKPNQEKVKGVFQTNDDLFLVEDFNETGIVFCSFDGNQKIIIPTNQSESLEFAIDFENSDLNTNFIKNDTTQSKINFENLVDFGILEINKHTIQKVVLSRKEVLIIDSFDLIKSFGKLVSHYVSAFRYCFYHPKIGLWMGATPEQLLQISDAKLTTVSLAGTQKFEGTIDVQWQEKEIEEQQIVTDFIANNLKSQFNNIEVTAPFTVRAGSLLHLKSAVSVKLNSGFNLEKTINILHPTPAVCGFPKREAKQFILENENYNREFYTGFLGELNIEDKTDLFVNLRCMKIENDKINIYVGCGITHESVPEKEFLETQNKSMTMKMVL